jgi:hypothetical protein
VKGRGRESENHRTKHNGISKTKSPSASDQKANGREGEELASKAVHKNWQHGQQAKKKPK